MDLESAVHALKLMFKLPNVCSSERTGGRRRSRRHDGDKLLKTRRSSSISTELAKPRLLDRPSRRFMVEPSSVSLCAIDTYKAVGLMGIRSFAAILYTTACAGAGAGEHEGDQKSSGIFRLSLRESMWKIMRLDRVARLRGHRGWRSPLIRRADACRPEAAGHFRVSASRTRANQRIVAA